MINSAAIYFILVVAGSLAITFWAARRKREQADLYNAGGRITGVQNGFAIAGEFMSSSTLLGTTALFFASGYDVGIFFYLCPLIGLSAMLMFLAAPMRRLGKYTLGDVVSSILPSTGIRLFLACSTLAIMLVYLVAQLVGGGGVIAALFGVPFVPAVIIVGALMTIYIMVGGMLAATWVQIIKAAIMFGAILVLGGICLYRSGGLPAMYQAAARLHPLGAAIFQPGGQHLSLFAALSLGASLLFGLMGLPHLLVRFLTVPTEAAARRSVVTAIALIGGVFVLLITVVGPATIMFVHGVGSHQGAAGLVKGGPNMVVLALASSVGGNALFGIMSAAAFATILAVVAGLTVTAAGAVSHDICATLFKARGYGIRHEMMVFRASAICVGVVSAGLAILCQNQNVSFLSALAYAIAASTCFPVLILSLYWKGLTVPGVLAGGMVGLVSSVGLIVLGPAIWVKELGHAAPLFPADYPTLVTMPAAILVIVVVSLLTRAGAGQPQAVASAQS